VRSLGSRSLIVKADLSRSSGAAAAVRAVHAKLGGPDILVCMASVYDRVRSPKIDERSFRANLDVDLASAFHLARQAAPLMKKAGAGGSSCSPTGCRAAAGLVTAATCRTTSPRPP